MPSTWSLKRTHDDLLRLAHFVLNSPFEDGILDGWVPTRKQGSRPGLAFSGGVDSTAAMMLMPPETALIYNERIGLKSILDHTNALRFIDELAKHGRPVLRVQSDHEGIRLTTANLQGSAPISQALFRSFFLQITLIWVTLLWACRSKTHTCFMGTQAVISSKRGFGNFTKDFFKSRS